MTYLRRANLIVEENVVRRPIRTHDHRNPAAVRQIGEPVENKVLVDGKACNANTSEYYVS
jgi:hypothetical protein